MKNHFREGADKATPHTKEKTYLHIIGALLSCVTGTYKDKKFSNETALREFIAEKYRGFSGISPRTTADIFKLARRRLEEEDD